MAMTENSRKVFDYLAANAQHADIVAKDIAEALGITVPVVTGSVNGLVKKGFAYREEVIVGQNEKGKDVVAKYIRMTPAGFAFDPDAVVETEA